MSPTPSIDAFAALLAELYPKPTPPAPEPEPPPAPKVEPRSYQPELPSQTRAALWYRKRTAERKAAGLTSHGTKPVLKPYRPRTGATYDRAKYMKEWRERKLAEPKS